jgi:rare lipoprotein A
VQSPCVRTLVIIFFALLATSCGQRRAPRAQAAKPVRIGATQTGIASWYGDPYHGRNAANGEVYDMERLTAAHRSWPFETWVQVKNLGNGKTVDVRITDRGPFVKKRVIDLSRAAAREIELIGPGTARVRLRVIKPPRAAKAVYAVQAGVFNDRRQADRVRDEMAHSFGHAIVRATAGTPPRWRVLVGEENLSESAARDLAKRVRASTRDAFVTRVD